MQLKRYLLLFLFVLSSCATNGLQERYVAATVGPNSCVDLVHHFFRLDNVEIPESQIAKMNTLGKSIGLSEDELADVKTFDSMISISSKKIFNSTGASDDVVDEAVDQSANIFGRIRNFFRSSDHGVKAGDSMANYFGKLRKIYVESGLSESRIRDLDFLVAGRVMRSESFTLDEMKKVAKNKHVMGKNSNLLHIRIDQYKEYTIAFKNNTAPYNGLDMSGGTIITRTHIRDMESLNRFPVYITHDMKHVRHGLIQERYMTTLFESARSKNHLRYAMLSALSEGADSVQYAEERALCKYMKSQGYDLEQAILYLGRASNAELKRIAEATGHASQFNSLASKFDNWVPTYTDEFPADNLLNEIDDGVRLLREQNSATDVMSEFPNFDNSIKY
jgi:hypothetical protein